MAVPTAVASNTAVGLSEVAAGTARYYSDSICTLAVTGTTIPAGQTNADFYLKPLTGGSTVQSAAAPFGTAQRTLNIVGAVRRGNCAFNAPIALADGGSTQDLFTTCAILPLQQNIGRTALFFQATTGSALGGTAEVRCRLNTTGAVTCNRNGGAAAGSIHWQTLELPAGLRVERVAGNCVTPPMTLLLPAAVNPSLSFLLKSYEGSSVTIDDDDLIVTQLVSPTTVSLDIGTAATTCPGGSFDIQAVELAGINVTRGLESAGIAIGANSRLVTGLSAVSANTALLTQHALPNSSDPICDVLLRAELPTPSSLNFSRATGLTGACVTSPILRMAWERIDFGSRASVQTKTVTLPINSSTLSVAISPVDTTRTIVFASSQAASGQGNGEASYAGGSYLGEGNARFELTSSTNVNVNRQRSLGSAAFTFYVVEFDP